MSDTPIVDAAAFQPDARLFVRVVLADKARDLERMCAELAASGEIAAKYSSALDWAQWRKTVAKWQEMQPNVKSFGERSEYERLPGCA